MYAQLGDITFETLKGFNDFSRTGTATYAEHKPLTGKPRLQPTGNSLDEIAVSMRFHISFCNPADELAALKQYRDENEVLPLKTNEKLEGNFIITDINETIEDTDVSGKVVSYAVRCTLREYIIVDRVQADQEVSRRNAAAVGDKKPVAKKKTNPGSCPKIISDLVTKIDNHAKAIDVIITQQGGTVQVTNRNTVLHHLSAIRLLTEDLLKRCDDPASCANPLPDLKYRAQQVFLSDNQFNTAVADNNTTRIPDENAIMLACVRNLKTAAAPLIKQSITG